jgi:hypothetical protein
VLEPRFGSGQDTSTTGMIFVVENEIQTRSLNSIVWPRRGVTFSGDNSLGAHVRVRYFKGARVPPPRAG